MLRYDHAIVPFYQSHVQHKQAEQGITDRYRLECSPNRTQLVIDRGGN